MAQNLLGGGDLVGGRRRVVAHDGKAAVLVGIDRHLIALAHRAVVDSGGDGIYVLALYQTLERTGA